MTTETPPDSDSRCPSLFDKQRRCQLDEGHAGMHRACDDDGTPWKWSEEYAGGPDAPLPGWLRRTPDAQGNGEACAYCRRPIVPGQVCTVESHAGDYVPCEPDTLQAPDDGRLCQDCGIVYGPGAWAAHHCPPVDIPQATDSPTHKRLEAGPMTSDTRKRLQAEAVELVRVLGTLDHTTQEIPSAYGYALAALIRAHDGGRGEGLDAAIGWLETERRGYKDPSRQWDAGAHFAVDSVLDAFRALRTPPTEADHE